MDTFTFPITISATATIEGEIADECRNTIGIDLRNALADEATTTTDNGAVLRFTGFAVADLAAEAPVMLAALRRIIAHIEPFYGEDEALPECFDEARAILARIDALPADVDADFADAAYAAVEAYADAAYAAADAVRAAAADLAEAAGDDTCTACRRPSLDCSRAPCASVIADREA